MTHVTKLNDLLSLKQKTAFITGGSGYLGTAMSEALAEFGADVVIGSRDVKKCEALARRLRKEYGTEASGIAVDIQDPASIQKAVSFIQNEYGRLDALVNNAWSGNKNTFDSITLEDWKYDVDVCLNGVFYTTKALVPQLKKTHGVIVNIASMYGHVAPDYRMYEGTTFANPPSYGASKAGVIQLTKYLASFLSPHGIRVNAISPGPFPHEATQKNKTFIERLASKTMLNRIGRPDDLKGAIVLLCSDASAYMTGQNLCVDGGWTAW